MMKIVPIAVFAISTILLSSCATPSQQAIDDKIDAALQEGITEPAQAAPPEDISAALIPGINLELPGRTDIDVELRFDLKVNRAPARQFFMGLVEGTPYNMVIHPDVKGRITLDLKNVSVAEVMKITRDVFGYDYEQSANNFHVYPNEMSSRIFKVNYLDVQRRGGSQMSVSSGQVTQNNGQSSTSDSSSSRSRGMVTGSQVKTDSQSSFWQELKTSLETIIGNKDGRSVVVSPQAGIVVVRAMPFELRNVEKFINQTQTSIQRQVIIEAKIIEVELNEKFQSGINWSALGTGDNGNNTGLASVIGGGSIFSGTGITGIAGNTGNLNPAALNPVDGSSTSAFGGVFTLALQASNDFSAFIELLKSQGDVKVLSSPKVSTINNQKAVIKVGQDEFFITDVSSNTNTGTATTTTQNDVELTPFFSGVALDVIPQISEQGEIILHIHPTVSTVIEKIKNISVSTTEALSVPLAVSSIRESDSIIRATNGQVVVIGGLMQDVLQDDNASVPGLGDVPVVGGLFGHTQQVKTKSELVILLKPIVVNGSRQWSDTLRQTRERISGFKSK
ncbi:MAG: pilus (MSHA type) biogenesis protein MshL [Thioalkalispiraceae bacterium]|jgi:MSHA biogenesis protein MshL